MTSPVAPALDPAVQKLRQVRDLASLVTYLHDELDWPVAEYNFEDLVFDITPHEAGLDASLQGKVRSIKRLRPLSNDQPWGIFFIDFVPGDLPITVLRRILRAVSIKKRELGRADRKAWQTDDLLFISVLGDEGDRDLNLAHFNEDPAGKRATLRVVEWDADDTAFAILRTRDELKNLAWRRDGETDELWRERWSKAFALRPREVAQTAKALASQMAQLAKLIRERVNEAIKVESEAGPLRELHTAFREVLLHDLTEDGFADMYAQTMTYGLFAARQSRPAALTLDTAVEMIPNTNPFLGDLLAQFTTANGLTHSLDFDELGVDALIDALQNANMEAVVADFGRAKPGEDPVIHFYEDFLREYNKKQKIQRGVFYTPKPVVSFIVRSVHELLQTEFQLPDGLASTETWGDMVARFPELKIPEGADETTPFVQILDPACGTGTFLVEVIDVIYGTLTAKWKREGRMALEHDGLWNDYVPKHLLPRLYGFELMMASYTIAHMKVGLKLGELGYKFAAAERLRIYLTNTLEPPQDFRGMFDIMAPALAHEARAVNEVKANTRFTVVIGNPPYSNFGRANRNPWILGLLEDYKKGLNEKKINLDDDFIKFFRFVQFLVEQARYGIVGLITNHVYLEGITHRRMRESLLETFPRAWIIDLHGSIQKNEVAPEGGEEQNVFDIKQGVAIALLARTPGRLRGFASHDLFGPRHHKYRWLESRTVSALSPALPCPSGPGFVFAGSGGFIASEYDDWWSIPRIMPFYNSGIQTKRDGLTIQFRREDLEAVLADFRAHDPEWLRTRYELGPDGRDWSVEMAKADVMLGSGDVVGIQYRPFDLRYTYFSGTTKGFIAYPRREVTKSILAGSFALVTMRQIAGVPDECEVFITRQPMTDRSMASTLGTPYLFPLFRMDAAAGPLNGEPNLSPEFRRAWSSFVGRAVVAEHVLHYLYAVLNSPAYRARYATRLRIDFPRVPTPSAALLDQLLPLGDELCRLHELPSKVPAHSPASFRGQPPALVETVEWSVDAVCLNKAQSLAFTGVSQAGWDFRIGGYQPAQKWLKDRRGRVLTEEDIEHYKRIIGAIEETIRIQKEIDEVIEAHGGWPAAFQGAEGAE